MERSKRAPIVGHLAGRHHTDLSVVHEASQAEDDERNDAAVTSLGLSSPESYQTSNLSQIQVLSGDTISSLYSPIRLVDSISGSDSTRSSLGFGHPSNHFVNNQLSPVIEIPAATSLGQQPGLSFRDHEMSLIDSGMVKRSAAESKPLPSLPDPEVSVPSPGHREVPTYLHIYDSEPHRDHVRQTSNDPEILPQEKTATNERRGTSDPDSSVHKQIHSVIPTKNAHSSEFVSVGDMRHKDLTTSDSGTDRHKDYNPSSPRDESDPLLTNAHRAKIRTRGRSTASPLVLPFMGKKRRRPSSSSPIGNINDKPTDSPAVSLIFESDSEDYDETESDNVTSKARAVKLSPSRTLGHGWGLRKKRQEVDAEFNLQRSMPSSQTPLHQSSLGRPDSRTSEHSKPPGKTRDLQRTTYSQRAYASRSAVPISTANSTSTVVGPASELEMFPHMDPVEEVDTFEKLEDLRRLMEKHDLDFYIVPSEDEHGSEYVALRDKRREFISGFTGLAGEAIISKSGAYLVTDFRYWHQAERELDRSLWTIIPLSTTHGPKDWIEWLFVNPDAELTSNRPSIRGARIGIDSRMISHEKFVVISSKINLINAEIVHPRQNLVDLVWRNRPMRSEEPVFKHGIEYAGQGTRLKLDKIRDWIREQPPSQPSYAKEPPAQARRQVGTLISSLPCIAWALNLRGSDIPYNPFFHAYLYVGLNKAVAFLQGSKVDDSVADYLRVVGIERRDFVDIWSFLRKREWGDGKILLSPSISWAVSTILTLRCTITQPYVEYIMAIKNDVEVEGLRKAYLRDGAALVRFLAWLDEKLGCNYKITEWEASHRLTEFRRVTRNFMGLAYQNTSATGPNAALPHYSLTKSTALSIDSETPYLIDSGGSYREGACCTARTMHYGRSTQEQREAYTRVLQGHIAVDSAVFPEGTTGQYFDALASKSLWKDGMYNMHGVGQGFGSVRTVHSKSNDIPLAPGHVVINEPGYYKHGAWGVRIGSALVVTRVRTKYTGRRGVWLGLERLTCVPIQTRLVKESMLTKEEKAWIKEHNQRCFEALSVCLKDDKRALNWLKRESSQGLATRLVHQILPS